MTKPAPFCWYELMTNDADAASAFYTHVVGWTAEAAQGAPEGVHYTLFNTATGPAAGMIALDEAACTASARPSWLGYVEVDDVDGYADRAKELGGSVHVGSMDIPDVGRFAIIGDPHGGAIGLFKWAQPMENVPTMPMQPGRVGWNELLAGDLEAAFTFYSDLLGWIKCDEFDMGPMGSYLIYGLAVDNPLGGMMTKPEQAPEPHWHYYLGVDDINAAVERVKAKGGQVIHGPMEVPGGAWIIQGIDPEGVAFELIAPPKEG